VCNAPCTVGRTNFVSVLSLVFLASFFRVVFLANAISKHQSRAAVNLINSIPTTCTTRRVVSALYSALIVLYSSFFQCCHVLLFIPLRVCTHIHLVDAATTKTAKTQCLIFVCTLAQFSLSFLSIKLFFLFFFFFLFVFLFP
jgi:hypothetical protein